MSHVLSRWSLVLVAVVASTSLGRAQDPIPVAYWSHQRQPNWGPPGVNAFTPPPAPVYYYYHGPQMGAGPQGMPEAGIRAPFIIPACAPNCSHHGHGGHGFNFKLPPPLIIDSLATHPYARSPRDFFMFHENLEAERSRDLRPTLVP